MRRYLICCYVGFESKVLHTELLAGPDIEDSFKELRSKMFSVAQAMDQGDLASDPGLSHNSMKVESVA